MKALNLFGIDDLRYVECPKPKREEGEVLLHIKACGICGSDIPRIFTKGTYHFPTIPGHEFAGEIVEADDVALVGRRAAVFPLLPCGKCEACQVGEYAQCKDYDYYGSRRDGAFAEYIAVKEWNLVFVDDNLSFEQAAMCEPAAVALHAVHQTAIGAGDTIAIFGAGPIGMLLASWAKVFGAFKVVLCDIDQTKIDFARSIGFDHAINSSVVDPVDYIMKITDGKGADAAIEGAGVSMTWEQCLKAVKSFGTVVCMGNPARDMTLSQKGYWEILRKQLTLKGTWNSCYNDVRNEWRITADAIANGCLDVSPLISHRFKLEDYKQAFDLIRQRKEYANKVMFINE